MSNLNVHALLCGLLLIGSTAPLSFGAGIDLTGKVVDAGGKPLEHATVLVYHAGVKTGYSTYCPDCYVDCGKRTVTDFSGGFRIKNLNADLLFEILVARAGYSPTVIRSVDPSKGPLPNAVLQKRQSATTAETVLRGRVVDPKGRPLRDSVVRGLGILVNRPNGRDSVYGNSAGGRDRISVTDERGEFDIVYDQPVLQVLARVEARGYAQKFFNHLPTGAERNTLTVSPGAVIRGRLMNHGKPVGNAQIGLSPRERSGGPDLNYKGSPYDEMRIGTQLDGKFVITNVPVPAQWFAYGKMDSLAKRGAVARIECETLTDGQELNLGDVQVVKGYSLRGKIVLSDGKPIAEGMHVFINAEDIDDSQSTLLPPDGAFEFTSLAPGKYRVGASVKGYKDEPWDYTSGRQRPGTVQIQRDTTGFVVNMFPREAK